MTKQEIRAEVRHKRKALSEQEWREKSHRICQTICSLPAYQQAHVIYAYLAKPGEVLLDELIQDAWQQGKQVAVPKVLGAEMDFFALRDLSEVEIGCMGIREPLSREVVRPEETAEKGIPADGGAVAAAALMLLPAVAVDEQGHRVGYGGGYYDKYLEKYPDLVKMAVVFGFQVYPQVPAEPFDIPLDRIVTEEKIWCH